jgi:redox-regulated HSP33 family molecular chaperone
VSEKILGIRKREKNKQRTRANFANKQSAVTFVCGCGDGRLPMVIKRLGREEDWCEEWMTGISSKTLL